MLLLNLSHHYRRWLAIAALIMLPLFARNAEADAKDTFNLIVGTNLMYDSNVFRLSPFIDPVTLLGQPTKSDQIITSTASLSMNKNYGMQRFEANGSIVDNRYHNFDFLNFIAKNYTTAWHWYVTPYFHGKLSSDRTESLNNFANLTGFINSTNRNLRTNTNHRFDGVFEISRALHIVGGISEATLRNSQFTVQDFDNRILYAEGGVRYVFPSGTSLTYKVRSGDGDFFKRPQPIASSLLDTRFHDMEHGLQLIWPVTIKTSIQARVAHFERKHEHFHQRDFSGFIGNFDFNWAVTGKTRLTASWARDLSNFQTASNFQLAQFQPFSSSYVATNRFSLAPVWQISAKTALRLRYDYITRDFLGAVIPIPGDNRSDSQHTGLIALDWQALNSLFVSATLQRDHRTSNLDTYKYDNTVATVSARLNF